MIILIDEPLRLALVAICLFGHLYALANWRSAREDRAALAVSPYRLNPLLRLIAQGYVDDQFRVALAQLALGAAGVLILFVPFEDRAFSAQSVGIFVSMFCCSTLLAWKSYSQNRRRSDIRKLIRAERSTS